MTGESIGERFDSGANALNLLRLGLTGEVLLWHAYSLTGRDWLPQHLEWFFARVGVDGFFAISGFLIARAWCRRPHLPTFLMARARRILPGLVGCLVVTGLVIVPLANWHSGGLRLHPPEIELALVPSEWVGGFDFAGPTGVPEPDEWNGSLWTLGYEVACYLLIAMMGTLGLLRRGTLTSLALAAWGLMVALLVGGLAISPVWLWSTPRLLFVFVCGALLWFLRDEIVVSRAWLGLAAVAVPTAAVLVPEYTVLAGPALAYLCVAGSLHLTTAPVLRHDLSYGVYLYGFPVQQALLMNGYDGGSPAGFFLVSLAGVVPLAALSWFLVERPALARSRRGAEPTRELAASRA